MNATLLCLMSLFSADLPAEETVSVYKPSTEFVDAIRGQSPDAVVVPADPMTNQAMNYQPPPPAYSGQPMTFDPFMGPPAGNPYMQHGTPNAGMFAFGANGPQPYRYGWTTRIDAGILPKEQVKGPMGQFGVTETDVELEFTAPTSMGGIFSLTPQFGYRGWSGPDNGGTGLPGSVYRFGLDMELATPENCGCGPWSFQLGFNPSINSDFEDNTTSDAYNWDGRGILFFRQSPHFLWAFGAGFWDRVNDRVIPYAGVVWTPNDRWEWRLVFPEPRISYFLGSYGGLAQWMYVRAEYHVEAYEITEQSTGVKDKIELEDWRAMLGYRWDNGFVNGYIEGGWVFGRNVGFLTNSQLGFDVSSGFIGRIGIRF